MSRPIAIPEHLAGRDDGAPLVRLVIIDAKGSAPRGPGAAMVVGSDFQEGTIGGGRLEYEAVARARAILRSCSKQPVKNYRLVQTWPLGPGLGQCCGGTVRVLFEHLQAGRCALDSDQAQSDGPTIVVRPTNPGPERRLCASNADLQGLHPDVHQVAAAMLDGTRPAAATLVDAADEHEIYFIEPLKQAQQPLFVYGAGHVGRALVKIVSDLDFDLYWVDTHKERFPTGLVDPSRCIVAREPEIIAGAAPAGAFHVVLTYSHAMDLAICLALLSRPRFGFLGLIGSATKRARFIKRLLENGIEDDVLLRLTCPIGLGALHGKDPTTIAVSVAAQLLERLEHARDVGEQQLTGEHGSVQPISA